MLRAVVLCAVFAAAHGAAALDPAQSAFSCKGCARCPNQPKTYVQPVVNVVHVLGKRLYVAATGPSIPAGAGGGFALTVNGQTGSVWPQVRLNATMGTNITVTLSGPIPFAGAVLTSYQFTNRPGANLYLTTDVATAYNCSTQTGSLKSVAAGTPTNTVAYAGAPIHSLTVSFSLANFAESTTLKWFVQPSLASPTVWYGPFPQVVNVYS